MKPEEYLDFSDDDALADLDESEPSVPSASASGIPGLPWKSPGRTKADRAAPETCCDAADDDALADLDESESAAPSAAASGIPGPLWKAPAGWTEADRAALDAWCAEGHERVQEQRAFVEALSRPHEIPDRKLLPTLLSQAKKNGFRDFFVARIHKQSPHQHARQDNEKFWEDFKKDRLAGTPLTETEQAIFDAWCAAAESAWQRQKKERQAFIAVLSRPLGDKPHQEQELVNTLNRAGKNGFRDFFVAHIRKQPRYKHTRQDNEIEIWEEFKKKGLTGKPLTETERALLDAWCAAADRDRQEYKEQQAFIAALSQLLSDISDRTLMLNLLNRAGKNGFRDYFIGRIRKQWPRRCADEYDECWQAFMEKKLLQGTLLANYDPARGSLFNLLCGRTALGGHVSDWFKRLTKHPENLNISESGDEQETSPMESIPTDSVDGLAEFERNELVGRLGEFYRELPPHQQIIMQYQWFDECPEQTQTQLAENIALILENRGLLDENGNRYSPKNIRYIINSIKRRLLVYFQGHIELISILRKP